MVGPFRQKAYEVVGNVRHTRKYTIDRLDADQIFLQSDYEAVPAEQH